MMVIKTYITLIFIFVLVVNITSKLIIDESFNFVKSSSTDKFVMFYKYDNTDEYKTTLKLLKTVAKVL